MTQAEREASIRAYLDLMEACDALLVANVRRMTNSEEELRAELRRLREIERAEHDLMWQRIGDSLEAVRGS
jgi:hypothetical protein